MATALGLEAWGVDPSVTRESRAGHRADRIHASIADARRAGAGPFDAILLMQVLEHITSPRAVLEEIRGALRPGGILLVEVPDARALRAAPETFEELRVVHPLEHVNAFTPETLEKICIGAGFKRVPRIPVHATTALTDVVRTALSRFVQMPSTSQYFVRT
jgi:SAM-dependent methyltransferase